MAWATCGDRGEPDGSGNRQGARGAVRGLPRSGDVVSGEDDDVCLSLGAYLVGSLVKSERAAFDRHLPDCAECRREIARLTPLLGLLRCVDPAEWCNQVPRRDATGHRGSSTRPVPGRRPGDVGGCGERRRLWWWRWSRR